MTEEHKPLTTEELTAIQEKAFWLVNQHCQTLPWWPITVIKLINEIEYLREKYEGGPLVED